MKQLKDIYKNITKGRKVLRKQIEQKSLNVTFLDAQLVELLGYHPKADEKNTAQIEYLVVRPHRVFKTPTLHFKAKGREEEDISAKQCLRVLFGKKAKTSTPSIDLQRALRHAIYDGSRGSYLLKHRGEQCTLCERTGDTVDHHPVPFSRISKDFLALRKCKPNISYTGYDYVLSNASVRAKWRHFHDSIATYRMLCRQCNSSIGNKSTPEPTKQDDIVVDNQCKQGNVAVGLCTLLEQSPLQRPVQEAADGVGVLCDASEPCGVVLETEAQAEVEVDGEGHGRDVAVEEQHARDRLLLKVGLPRQKQEDQRGHMVQPSGRCKLLDAPEADEIV